MTNDSQAIEQTAQQGADSVFAYLQRTAEPVADGVRWPTLDWHNHPWYNASVFYGVAGITFFLADYHRFTGSVAARELAEGAVRWCSSPNRTVDPDDEWSKNGLVRGRAGTGMAWLRLAQATGEERYIGEARAVGRDLVRLEPGPYTDFLDGEAGIGIFLLRLAVATGDGEFLAAAVRRAEWFERVAIRDAHGCYWPWDTGGTEHSSWFGLSFVPGSSGIGYFLLALYEQTKEERWAALARATGETLTRQAVPDKGGLNWPDTLNGFSQGEERKCQWCHGASGVGVFYVKAYEALRDHAFLATARAAGETTFQYGDVRRSPVQCHGLAGNAELFLELYRATHEALWLERAHHFAKLCLGYRRSTPEGEWWQADDPGVSSPDFMMGAAGTGHFFLRLWRPDQLTRPLL